MLEHWYKIEVLFDTPKQEGSWSVMCTSQSVSLKEYMQIVLISKA